MKKSILTFFFLVMFPFLSQSQSIYFPPIGSDNWDTVPIAQLGWDESKIEPLLDFLNQKNTKAFILLKDGKIVIEKYFDSFTKDSIWYWASAAKTLTAAIVGIAQEEGFLSINDKTSKYLGIGWTSCPQEKEDLITIRHQLTMTTGLDYQVEDIYCTDPQCLKYRADAGTQWYYHNAPYTLLRNVVEKATGINYNSYFFQKIGNQVGMNGFWINKNYNNVYYSNARSLARYGILIANNGFWEDKNIIKDKEYLNQMINTSQELNKSYGYLWWLNGKESFVLPGKTRVFNGSAMPDAPSDMYAALGKDGQILNVVPSKSIILVRMGERPDDQLFISNIFNNEIWKFLNELIDGKTNVNEEKINFIFSQNLESEYIEIVMLNKGARSTVQENQIQIYNSLGICVTNTPSLLRNATPLREGNVRINVSHLPSGVYFVRVGGWTQMFLKI